MPSFKLLTMVGLFAAFAGQATLLWLQLRAHSRYRHKSFAILAAGTILGLIYTALASYVALGMASIPTAKQLFLAAMIFGVIQVPVAIWGVTWLFQSYGQLYLRNASVLPNTSLERTRGG